MIDFLFSQSAVTALYLPAGVAAALVAFGAVDGFFRRFSIAGWAVAAGFFLGFQLTRSIPLIPPIGGIGWIPFALGAGLAIGLAADHPRLHSPATLLFVIGLPPILTWMIGAEEFLPGLHAPAPMAYSILALSGVLVFSRLALRAAGAGGWRLVLYAAMAVAALGWTYGTRMSLHAITLAAVLAGAGFASWLFRQPWPASASFAAGATYFAMAASLFLSRDLFALPVGVTMLVFFAPDLAAILVRRPGPVRLGTEILLGAAAVAGAPIALQFAP